MNIVPPAPNCNWCSSGGRVPAEGAGGAGAWGRMGGPAALRDVSHIHGAPLSGGGVNLPNGVTCMGSTCTSWVEFGNDFHFAAEHGFTVALYVKMDSEQQDNGRIHSSSMLYILYGLYKLKAMTLIYQSEF